MPSTTLRLLCLAATAASVLAQSAFSCGPGYYGMKTVGCVDIDECGAPFSGRDILRSCVNQSTGEYNTLCGIERAFYPQRGGFDGDPKTCTQKESRNPSSTIIRNLNLDWPWTTNGNINITHVFIWNDMENPDALAGFEVYVVPKDMSEANAVAAGELHRCALYNGTLNTTLAPIVVNCEGKQGADLVIRLPDPSRVLSVCEMQIYDNSPLRSCPESCSYVNTVGSFQCSCAGAGEGTGETEDTAPIDGGDGQGTPSSATARAAAVGAAAATGSAAMLFMLSL